MNNKGVSAIIGVILMFAITVAIVATVYVYVSGMIGYDEDDYIFVYGNVSRIETIYSNGDIDYRINFVNNDSISFMNYLIGDDDFDWVLGEYYEMELGYSGFSEEYWIKEYVLVVEEL